MYGNFGLSVRKLRNTHFEEKLVDVVGLYLNPPERAEVFSFDEKTQVQALDRTQPSLPMKKGRGSTMTHDYRRHGTTDLFAAMNVATGEVIHDTKARHSSKGVLAFFKSIDAQVKLTRDPRRARQSLGAQVPTHHDLVSPPEARTLAPALHADQFVVAQSRRKLVQPTHQPSLEEGHVLLGRSTERRHRSLDRKLERRSPTVHLEEARRRDHREG